MSTETLIQIASYLIVVGLTGYVWYWRGYRGAAADVRQAAEAVMRDTYGTAYRAGWEDASIKLYPDVRLLMAGAVVYETTGLLRMANTKCELKIGPLQGDAPEPLMFDAYAIRKDGGEWTEPPFKALEPCPPLTIGDTVTLFMPMHPRDAVSIWPSRKEAP